MRIEDQVVSLELAKKMKELGFEQESLCWWSKPWDINCAYTGDELEIIDSDWLEYHDMEKAAVYSAYTVAELGEMLPKEIFIGKKCNALCITKYKPNSSMWNVSYVYGGFGESFKDKSEANARAKMLIHLKKNKLGVV